MQIEGPRASRVHDVLLVPFPQLFALLWKEKEGGRRQKGFPLGGGKHALSAVVLDPVKACVALTIITSYIFIVNYHRLWLLLLYYYFYYNNTPPPTMILQVIILCQ